MGDKEGKTFGELVQFTPVFDHMIEKYGHGAALVYGRIWRRCQGVNGICYESIPSMSKGTGLSHNTIRKYLDLLCEAGEIFAEEREGKATIYRVSPENDLPLPKLVGVPLPKLVDEDTIKETNTPCSPKSHKKNVFEEVNTTTQEPVVEASKNIKPENFPDESLRDELIEMGCPGWSATTLSCYDETHVRGVIREVKKLPNVREFWKFTYTAIVENWDLKKKEKVKDYQKGWFDD